MKSKAKINYPGYGFTREELEVLLNEGTGKAGFEPVTGCLKRTPAVRIPCGG